MSHLNCTTRIARFGLALVAALLAASATTACAQDAQLVTRSDQGAAIQTSFRREIQPLLTKYCRRCHNADEMMSGIRVDRLDGTLPDRHLALWHGILRQVGEQAMPPEDQPQPSAQERRVLTHWIEQGLSFARRRPRKWNGSIRRLTVSQYRNTLRDLLGIDDDLTDILPPDSISKDGFLNNQQSMVLSPLLIEAYFDIADEALERCMVDEDARPVVQNFRVDLGAAINPEPCPDELILGALSRLLKNDDFVVTELQPTKPFAFEPFAMRTQYRFIEGYQGNATVRGWREYDSLYHAVFACVRGTDGYPKGLAYETVPDGLLLRPAVPSAELFQVESTYGPKANFKISLRELPDRGRFRVTVTAARYNDGLLLEDRTTPPAPAAKDSLTIDEPGSTQSVQIQRAGIYQVDAHALPPKPIAPDASKLQDKLIGFWRLEENGNVESGEERLAAKLQGSAKYSDSPFGKALEVDGTTASAVVASSDELNVGTGEFTVAAWIRPGELRQAGIVCRGGYGYTHGWLLDMPGADGVLRLETATRDNAANGTVQSKPGVLHANRWQHVAAVVKRGKNKTRLFVNGYPVAQGTIRAADLDNPKAPLHLGRVQDANLLRGALDEVRLFRRALEPAELQALVQPGRKFAKPPQPKPQLLSLQLGERHFSGMLRQPAFLAVRLDAGPLDVSANYAGNAPLDRIVLTPLDDSQPLVADFKRLEARSPRLGVHVGLRRDCGSTLAPVGRPQTVSDEALKPYVFEGEISNFPSPNVEKDNVNYLAGIREIGVRNEYTDGRDMPRLRIRSVEFEGPFYESWPPAAHRRIFIESDHPRDSPQYAREVIGSFASRAYRRPATESETESLLAVWKESYSRTRDFQSAIKDALLVVLTSPQFVFLIESSRTPDAEPLEPYELASKLSYFLWNTAPDSQLLEQAASGSLPKSLDEEIPRMIRDPRFRKFSDAFTSQWLRLDKLDVVETDRKRFPRLTRDTKTQLRLEPARYVEHLIRHNLPLSNLVQSDFIVANEVVASYYGLGEQTESGFAFVPVKHRDEQLGGLLSQAGILAGLSDGRESNPVKRGAWLARKIIAEPPDDPPPNVPALPEEGSGERTLREKLEQHRNQKGCMKCHAGIDPWGIPLEQFDAAGRFKRDAAVEASSTLPDGTEIVDARRLKQYLADERLDQVAFSFLKHLTSYATGRSLGYNEIELLKEKGLELKPHGYRMQDMMRFVIKSKPFLNK